MNRSLPTRQDFLVAVNKERAKKGVAPLKLDERLNMSAQYKANDMHTRHYFSHEDPKTGKDSGLDMIQETGIPCVYISENFTSNTSYLVMTLDGSMKAWIHSKPHYQAMVDPRYTLTGFGIEDDVVVEHFCHEK